MRYLVTGAAGFIGSHLAETLERGGSEVVGIDCFTDYYDPALKEENARGIDVLRLDLAEDELDLTGFDGVFHLAGQPGVRSFGDVFPLYLRRNVLASQRVFEAAARDGARVVFASSSSVYGAAERYPTPEDTRPLPLSPYGITKLACEQLAAAYAREFGARLRRAALLQRLRAAAAARHGVHAHRGRPRRRRGLRPLRRRRAVARAGRTSATSSMRRSWRWRAGAAPTTSAARSRRRCNERDRGARVDLGPPARGAPERIGAGRPAADECRHDPHPGRARLVAAGVARGRAPRPVGMGLD